MAISYGSTQYIPENLSTELIWIKVGSWQKETDWSNEKKRFLHHQQAPHNFLGQATHMSDSGACTAPSTQGKSLASGKALWQEGREVEERLMSGTVKQRKTGVRECCLETRAGSPHPRD
jgi:O-glycosyl hydrolase